MISCLEMVLRKSKMKIHACLLLVIVFLVNTSSTADKPEIQDVTAIYITHQQGANYEVDTEIHSRTNSLGLVLSYDNGTFLVPATSKVIPNFQCLHSNISCEWDKSGRWVTQTITREEFKALSLQTPVVSCDFNNGGCQVNCSSISSRRLQCSCPPNYVLQSNNTCSTTSHNRKILRANSGLISSPNYPSNYYNNIVMSWLIVSELHTRISYTIPKMTTERGYDFIRVDDGNGNRTYDGVHNNISLTSNKNFMIIYFTTDSSNTAYGFNSSYNIETTPNLRALKLIDAAGEMVLPLQNFVPTDLCVSLVYKLASSHPPQVKVEHFSSKYTTFLETTKKVVKGWIISQHMPEKSINITDKPINLVVTWKGVNTAVYNIQECGSKGEEEVYILNRKTWTVEDFPELKNASAGDKLVCSNGGIFHEKTATCVCPPGFAGEKCEAACGPNRYGKNCGGVCSGFEKGCMGMIFCNNYNICSCATGFSGMACNIGCDDGYYGPNCNIKCGHCLGGICNKFTGECVDGCMEGYFPPYCHNKYVRTLHAPNLEKAYYHEASITFDAQNLTGKGSPHLFVTQYKVENAPHWTSMEPQVLIGNKVYTVILTGLNAGTFYLTRIIIISKDGNSYQGSDIPKLRFETVCEVPNSNIYEIKNLDLTSNEFTIEWKYNVESDKWCPTESYDVILEERWRKFYSKVLADQPLKATFKNLWPYHQYNVYLCATSRHGKAPCSAPFATTTTGIVPKKVMYLTVHSTSARNIHISWKKPLFPHGIINGYRIQYQCLKYYGCSDSCEHSRGSFNTTQTSAIIAGLLPYSQYKVRVAAYTSGQGPFRDVFAMTQSAIPDNNPVASEIPVTSVSNTSAVVHWKSPPCFGINGNFKEYFLYVFPESDSSKITFRERTINTTATITGLEPKTNYIVYVYTVNTHGWNLNYKLTIPLSTRATVPDAVTNLEVYKRGRRMIGLRWAKPSKVYGDLKSFTIIHRLKDGNRSFEETIPPTPCLGWPDLYCYTINTNLHPDKYYVVTVKARNNEINEDGIGAEIITQCRENAPEAPSFLNILVTNSTSFWMEWGIPKRFNGELRSFLVNVEHIDALTEDECCEYFPVQELPFREENSQFSLQVDGLVPASTYIASVSGKTILLGPSVNATFNTAPLPLSSLLPPLISHIEGGRTYTVKIMNTPETSHSKLKSLYLLLVLHDHANITSNIWKNDLLRKITSAVNNRTFYIASEFNMDETTSEENIIIGKGRDTKNGTIGEIKDPLLNPGDYTIGLAVLLSFGDATSITFAEGDIFTVN